MIGHACSTTDPRGYWNGCRSPECRTANATYSRDRKRARARPDALPTPSSSAAGQVRAHLELLRSHGVGTPAIAARSGVSRSQVSAILAGEVTRIRPVTRDALLGVMPSHVAAAAYVSTDRAATQLEELVAIGWTSTDLARAVYGPTTKQRRVDLRAVARRSTVDAIAALHAQEFPAELDLEDRDPLAAWRLLIDEGALDWKTDAACRYLDGDVKARQHAFFPERGEQANMLVRAALAVCDRCPVTEPCLDLALASPYTQGVWGATTGEARREIRHLELTAAEALALAASDPSRPLARLLEDVKRERADAVA